MHTMTVFRHGKTGGLNLPNCRQFNRFIEKLLRFWYVCLIGPLFARSYDEKMPAYKLEPHHPGSIAYDVLADWLIAYNHENA